MKNQIIPVFITLILLFAADGCNPDQNSAIGFSISLSDTIKTDGLNGRLMLLLADNDLSEPRFQVSSGSDAQLVYAVEVEDMKSSTEVHIDAKVFGFPLTSIADIPAGDYYVQAFLHIYEEYELATGHKVMLPVDRGEGQRWNVSPGNLYSIPEKITIEPDGKQVFNIELSQTIQPIEPPEDSEYIKHVRLESRLLSEFWGRPTFLQANVLVPEGFDKRSDAQYPLMIFHGHFPYTFGGFRTIPPDADPQDSIFNSRFRIYGYDYIQQKEAYDLYKRWISEDFPRYVVIEIQHQNPYYDDSYAVNSANLGPYGDAITFELIPFVEEMFNCIGEGWGRFLYGGSTGGWEALAVQVFYPDEYNGCFAACPDPIDFRAYTVVDIYEDENAYFLDSKYKRTPRPGTRDNRGHISSTLEEQNHLEYVLGTESRSGGQWDIWQAVYSPMGGDGYPKPIWDKVTGRIDHEVAAYWRENYDLCHIMKRDWNKIGHSLAGKIHIYCGDMDNYYLNNAVRLTEEFLESTSDPYYEGVVDYGDGAEHCWNGDHDNPNQISRLRYNTMYLPAIRERLKKTAPANHRLVNWDIQ